MGKTVLLDDFAVYVRQAHMWPVLSHQVVDGEPLCEAIAAKLVPVARELAGRHRRVADAVVRDLTVGVQAGVSVSKSFGRTDPGPARASLALEAALQRVGEQAADRGRALLVVVDEVHAADDTADLAGFSRAVQSANRARLPVHLLVAGLTDTRLRQTSGATFLERLEQHHLANLDAGATRVAVLGPLNSRGVSIEPRALDAMVAATMGYPYFIQLLGARTWEAAAGAARISADHVAAGIDAAGDTVHHLYQGRWDRLSPQARRFVQVMAELDPDARAAVPIRAIAARLDRTSKSLSMVRDSLIADHQLVTPGPARGELQFVLPYFARWVGDGDPDRPRLDRVLPAPGPPELEP